MRIRTITVLSWLHAYSTYTSPGFCMVEHQHLSKTIMTCHFAWCISIQYCIDQYFCSDV